MSLLFLYEMYKDSKKSVCIMDISHCVRSRLKVTFMILVTDFWLLVTAWATFAELWTIHNYSHIETWAYSCKMCDEFKCSKAFVAFFGLKQGFSPREFKKAQMQFYASFLTGAKLQDRSI